jgi:hypothetical protein
LPSSSTASGILTRSSISAHSNGLVFNNYNANTGPYHQKDQPKNNFGALIQAAGVVAQDVNLDQAGLDPSETLKGKAALGCLSTREMAEFGEIRKRMECSPLWTRMAARFFIDAERRGHALRVTPMHTV